MTTISSHHPLFVRVSRRLPLQSAKPACLARYQSYAHRRVPRPLNYPHAGRVPGGWGEEAPAAGGCNIQSSHCEGMRFTIQLPDTTATDCVLRSSHATDRCATSLSTWAPHPGM